VANATARALLSETRDPGARIYENSQWDPLVVARRRAQQPIKGERTQPLLDRNYLAPVRSFILPGAPLSV